MAKMERFTRKFDHEVGAVLKIRVPCQFGPGGKHSVSVATNGAGDVLGFRTGCDDLPKDIEETGAALAEHDHACCREVVRAMLSVVDGARKNQHLRRYGNSQLERATEVVGHDLMSMIMMGWASNAAVMRAHRVMTSPVRHHLAFLTSWEDTIRERTGGGERFELVWAAKKLVLEYNGTGVATYRGRGVWQMAAGYTSTLSSAARGMPEPPVRRGQGFAGATRRCPVCDKEIKNFDAHAKSPRHATKFHDVVVDSLNEIANQLHRAR